ncbi:hypothetical protein BN2476_500029 [Paraburkholderia piptadeniae]|uniref:Uncharacterized protein n=1 Tax=Paraburkholderia piptadeniae TaxID=1701573 RepID=A0A1N7SGI0_9BURK|nr:hypothetical protein [Paraburkholderia piptadeniae]SIT46079.1 hypothetical protein BN2476_500029 [Paraburkholderia piptadeniae]
MIRQEPYAPVRARRHIESCREWRARVRFVTLVRRLVLTVCGLALCAADALAVQPGIAPTIVVLPLERFGGIPAKPSAKVHAPKPMPARTMRRKRKGVRKTGARHPDIYYRWSTEQLMLGGVNPSGIGKEAASAGGKLATDSAARARQKPRRLHQPS